MKKILFATGYLVGTALGVLLLVGLFGLMLPGCATSQPLRVNKLDRAEQMGDANYVRENVKFVAYAHVENSGFVQWHSEAKNIGSKNVELLAKCGWGFNDDIEMTDEQVIQVPPGATHEIYKKSVRAPYMWKCNYYYHQTMEKKFQSKKPLLIKQSEEMTARNALIDLALKRRQDL